MAPVSMMVKPSLLASWRATLLFPAPGGPSMATMGAVTRPEITRAGTRSKRSGVERHQEHEPEGRQGGDAPGQPGPRCPVGFRQLIFLVVGRRNRHVRHCRSVDDEHRREHAWPAEQDEKGES